jgi:hypothetical protein
VNSCASRDGVGAGNVGLPKARCADLDDGRRYLGRERVRKHRRDNGDLERNENGATACGHAVIIPLPAPR